MTQKRERNPLVASPLSSRFWACMIVLAILAAGCRVNPSILSSTTTAENLPSIRLLFEPDAQREPLLDLINSAKRSIRLETDLLDDKEIIDPLVAAKSRGVDVRVILEAEPSGFPIGNKPAMDELLKGNVSVKTGNPAFKQTHAKTIVADNRVAAIFTVSQTQPAFVGFRSFVVIDSNPSDVAEITRVLDSDWNRSLATLSVSDLVWGPGQSRTRLLGLIDGAQRTLDIEAEQLQDNQIVERLKAAVQRGVTVRLIMSPIQTGIDENLAAQDKLTKGGIQLRFLKNPEVHGTLIIADQARGFIGSQDLTAVSLDSYRDLGIELHDPVTVRGMTLNFASDWNASK